jgi:hypothetical protein
MCAAAALAAFGAALLVIVAILLRSMVVLPLVVAGLVVAVLAGWSSLVCAARVQRRVSATGVVMVARQPIALGRVHAGKTVTIDVTDTELVVACDDGPRTFRRTTELPIRNLKADRPRKAGS